jgi:protein-L-isoaspartate(D-aspartate) O-methyltransferase
MAKDRLKDGARVLDVGSGSGYLAVCFAHLVGPRGHVVGIEHIDGLVKDSIANTRKSHQNLLDSGRLLLVTGDGRQGYPSMAPYDVIHVGAASSQPPQALLDQLAPGGILIIPIGNSLEQAMRSYSKDQEGRIRIREDIHVRYVPLTSADRQLI